MDVVKQTDRLIVLDDFLPEQDFQLMVQYAQKGDYARNPRWIKPWDLGDEMPWQTGETVYTHGLEMRADDPRKAYPTGMAVDLMFDRLLGTKFVRQHLADTFVTARTYLHPPESGLDWHDDEGRFAGAYSYYVHPRWHASWGGELMVIEDEISRALLPDKQQMTGGEVRTVAATWDVIDKEDLSTTLMTHAKNTGFVFPRPNRLVIMRGGLWHKVAVVKRNAPIARCAVAGFFLPRDDDTPFWGDRSRA